MDVLLRQELQQSPIDVARTALHLARVIAYPDLDVAAYLTQLDELAQAGREWVSPAESLANQASALATFLFQEQGFQGNETDYGDPRNSFLNDVLDRRLGLPITLSVLYVAVAQRIGLPAYGVNLPGHFIVAVHDEVEFVFLDPFHGGMQLSLTDCARLVKKTTGYKGKFRKAWLEPAQPLDILIRMLNNLRLIYVQWERWPKALLVMELLHQMQPGAITHLRDLGLAHFQNGSIHLAATYLEAYLQRSPQAPDIQVIRQNFTPVIDAWVRLN